jgi:type II secretory ATPase GspE/PulE/Tfp pilus assembly ATPase PilB-like protein
VAVRLEKNLLTVAMSDPLLFSLVQDLEFQTGYRIKQVGRDAQRHRGRDSNRVPGQGADSRDDAAGSQPCRDRHGAGAIAPGRRDAARGLRAGAEARGLRLRAGGRPVLKERSESAPIIDLVDLVVKSAIKSKASDIHVEPMEKGVLIRHRLDGLLKEVMDLPKWVHEGLIARLKIMAGMDIAEKRLPQDGRLRSTSEDGTGRRLPGVDAPYAIRRKSRDARARPPQRSPALEEIGMSAAALEEVRQFLRHQHGMILVVGPTGSGKTTTLSASLKSVQSERANIITIEDPIEYQIPGVNQTQINEKIKLTFASALRSILRQDARRHPARRDS